jgi:hypothetical protein
MNIGVVGEPGLLSGSLRLGLLRDSSHINSVTPEVFQGMYTTITHKNKLKEVLSAAKYSVSWMAVTEYARMD